MTSEPDLSVVVPVRDAATSVRPLVESILALPDVHPQVVLVDDGSVDGSTDVIKGLAAAHDQVTALFHEDGLGAGVARNAAFPHVVGRYVLFFDADDILHGDAVSKALPLLDASGADVAMMPYAYQRDATGEDLLMHPPDQAIWQGAVRYGRHRVARLCDAPDLLGFTNYPWNKILRTDTYRRAGLRFGGTPVHNDILGHWYSLLSADSILLLDEVICTHVVRATGRNLTNRNSRVRLTLFDALDETYDLLDSRPLDRQRYAPQYWAFAIRTSDWAEDRIGPQFREAFQQRRREHLRRIELADFARLRMDVDPELAQTLARKAVL